MTHEQVLAAIDKARPHMEGALTLNPALDWRFIRNAHCDDLRATAERHFPNRIGGWCDWCTPEGVHGYMGMWPCPDAQQVIDRLAGWGVL